MSQLNFATAAESTLHEPDLCIVDTQHSANWVNFRELWRYRDLIWILAIRDITVRYRQTIVGIAWTVLQPLSLMLALGLFKRLATSTSVTSTIPEPLTTLSGLILYQLFSSIIGTSTICLVDNRQMLTKVYFPRIALPLAASLRPLIDFGIGIIVLTALMIWYQFPPTSLTLIAPLFVIWTYLVAVSSGLWLSALNAHYRDFGHIVPLALQLGLIISPIAVDSARLTGWWRWLYFLNPMAGLLEGFRWSLLGSPFPGWMELSICVFVTAGLVMSGLWYFRRVERFLADSI